jgi:hypothetical protein
MGVHSSTSNQRKKKQKTIGPAAPSSARLAMIDKWRQMEAVLGGTHTMRQAGRTYLPQHLGEEDDRYSERIDTATLWNQTELTLAGWVGRPFRDPLELNKDVPEQIRALENDIDREGTNMDAFARDWFKKGISKAFCHVLVEAPSFDSPDGNKPTLSDERELGLRPYWVLIDPTEVIAARHEITNGRDVITHLRLYEATTEVDPNDEFDELHVERIRVFNRVWEVSEGQEVEDGHFVVQVTMYKKGKNKRQRKEDWHIDEEHPSHGRIIQVPSVPLVTFYSNREGFMLGKSPLQDLGDLNVKHWQKLADLDNIIRVASFPILAASGIDPDEGVTNNTGYKGAKTIGPYNFLYTGEAGGKYYYVEHSGKAIKAAQDSLDVLEHKMGAYGSEFLKKQPDRQTATARTLDSAEASSPLQDMTLRFAESFEQALALTGQMIGITSTNPEDEFFAGTITIVTDFGPEEPSGIDLNALITARANKDISRNTFLGELIRRGILPKEFDPDVNYDELEQEVMDAFGAEALSDIDGAGDTGGDNNAPSAPAVKKEPEKKEEKDVDTEE